MSEYRRKLVVPRYCIYGTQHPSAPEYCDKKRKRVETGLSKEGSDYLLRKPISLCVLPIDNSTSVLALDDGHHRVRYSPPFNQHYFPALLFSLEELAEEENMHPADLQNDILARMARTTLEFSRKMDRSGKKPPTKRPVPIDAKELLEILDYGLMLPTALAMLGFDVLD